MRKKIFATLMSVAMVASFMPSIAFAANTNDATANHDYYDYGVEYKIENGKAVAKNGYSQEDVDKYVKVITAPTCSTEGLVELKCTTYLPEGVDCDQTTTRTIKKLRHDPRVTNMSLEAFANQLLAQKDLANAGAVKSWIAANKDKCYVEASRCRNCGVVDAIGSGSSFVDHAYTGDNICAKKVQCTNPGCSAMIDTPAGKNTKAHDYTGVTPSTSEITACGGVKITVTKTACKDCGVEKVDEANHAAVKCVNFKGDLPKDAVKKSGDDYLYQGQVIATVKAGNVVAATGYHYDETNGVFAKADTTKTILTTPAGKDVYVDVYGYTCNDCGYVNSFGSTTPVAAAHKHVWEKVTVDATCSTPAQECMVCTECGNYKRVKDADNVTGVASATSVLTDVEGSKALGHELVVKTNAGDCQGTMSYEVKCSRKGCKARALTVTAADFKAVAKGDSLYVDPNVKNIRTTTKNIVGSTELKYIADSTGDNHKFTKKVVVREATCEANKLEAYVCDTCGKINIHSATMVPGTKLGHKFKETEVKATCGTEGYKIAQCENCGEYKTATGTTKKADEALKMNVVKPLVAPGAKCSFDKVVVLKDSTVFEEGVKTFECSKCGAQDSTKAVIAKKTVKKPVVTVKAGKKAFTVKASADNATGYKVVYKRAGKKAITKVVDAEKLSKTYKKLAKGKKYTVKVTAFASNGTETVYGATTTKTVKTK